MGLETEGKVAVRSRGVVISVPSCTGRMGSEAVADSSRLTASEKREPDAVRISEVEREERQDVSVLEQLSWELK